MSSLVAESHSAKWLHSMLLCVSDGRKDQVLDVDVDSDGMTFKMHSKAKSLQLKTTVSSKLFDEYSVKEDEDIMTWRFRVLHWTFLEQMNVFGTPALDSTSITLTYKPDEAFLSLSLEDEGVVNESQIQTLTEEDTMVESGMFEQAFEESPVVAKLLIQSKALKEAFAELVDLPKAASIEITMFSKSRNDVQSSSSARLKASIASSEDSCFRMSAKGEAASCDIDFAANSSAIIEFECDEPQPVRGTYHLAVLQLALKAINVASETYVRINEDGILSVQHMIETSNGHRGFIDALLCPEESLQHDDDAP